MNALPDEFLTDWAERESLAALATVAGDGTPNVIWVACLHLMADDACVLIADNWMDKTHRNLDATGIGALVILALPRRAWQLKGTLSHHTEGELFDNMKHGWLDPSHPGNGVVCLELQELWQGAEQTWQRNASE